MTVLLWGRCDEAVVAAVAAACERRRVEFVIADGDELESVTLDGDLVTRHGDRVPMCAVTGLFVRPEATPTTDGSRWAFEALTAWAELSTAAVLNRPSAAASNRSKPFQLGIIADAGFAVPDTLVTTDPADVRAFHAQHGKVIYKSVSGVRSIVALLNPGENDRIADVTSCPTQFQQFVAGTDYRVHVVDDRVFACRIATDAVDYRYAGLSGPGPMMEPVALPDQVSQVCLDTTARLGLALAGIDLRLDTDGTWWCFEVNTSPGFIWFERQTGQPIADAVAAALTRIAS